jgi:hypothetical protein
LREQYRECAPPTSPTKVGRLKTIQAIELLA